MCIQYTLPQVAKIVEGLCPAADAGGRSGDWVSLKTCHKAYVLVSMDQGNAATVAVTFQQASDVAGTGAKPLTGNVRIWANQDCAATDTLVAVTAAKTLTTSAAVAHKQVLFEFVPQTALDVANGFDCIQVVTGASNAANITSAVYILTPLVYAQATPPSAIID